MAETVGQVFSAVSSWVAKCSPSKRQHAADALAALLVTSMPQGWNGEECDAKMHAVYNFPCFGKACVAKNQWISKGSWCKAYRDVAFQGSTGE